MRVTLSQCALGGVILALAVCHPAGARTPNSGISGRVLAAPTCPVETVPPQPGCAPRPLAATLRVRRVGSVGPYRLVHAGTDGRFRVSLLPATYVVQALSQGGARLPRPPEARHVRVRAAHFTSITLSYDTGIR
jgi:hypothetical protein